jgi:hypothetical protein
MSDVGLKLFGIDYWTCLCLSQSPQSLRGFELNP